ncbi:hypothetical protein AYO47_00120 [Planctomyces sp. SCGC AG-212-M04]|nr:hypothetical protein AYO47_00120 [Planctomyces sp. SCGC AG-212-M04]
MTNTPPKPKRRRWRWLVLCSFAAIGVMRSYGCTSRPSPNAGLATASDAAQVEFTDFDKMIETARTVAAETKDDTSRKASGQVFTARIAAVDSDQKTMAIEIKDAGQRGASKSRAFIAFEQVAGRWRVKSMTSDWAEFGLENLVIEQQIVDRICKKLDSRYSSPRSDREKNKPLFESLARMMDGSSDDMKGTARVQMFPILGYSRDQSSDVLLKHKATEAEKQLFLRMDAAVVTLGEDPALDRCYEAIIPIGKSAGLREEESIAFWTRMTFCEFEP